MLLAHTNTVRGHLNEGAKRVVEDSYNLLKDIEQRSEHVKYLLGGDAPISERKNRLLSPLDHEEVNAPFHVYWLFNNS